MSLNASLLVGPLVDFITGKIIEAGTGGDATKIVARAKELIAINTAFLKVNAGDVTGLPELQQAFGTTALSPGESLALQSFFASLGSQVALLTNVAGSTLIGQSATVVLDSILNSATVVAQAYVTKDGAPA
jgi:hypothetical protein